jgi:Zn-dependent oligopeptidase
MCSCGQNRRLIDQLAALEPSLDGTAAELFDRVVVPLERARQRLGRVWSPVSHLNAVMNSEDLREAYNQCLAKLTGYATEMAQNEALCSLYKRILEADEGSEGRLDAVQRRVVEDAVRDFRLSGVDLPAEKKARFKEVMNALSRRSRASRRTCWTRPTPGPTRSRTRSNSRVCRRTSSIGPAARRSTRASRKAGGSPSTCRRTRPS